MGICLSKFFKFSLWEFDLEKFFQKKKKKNSPSCEGRRKHMFKNLAKTLPPPAQTLLFDGSIRALCFPLQRCLHNVGQLLPFPKKWQKLSPLRRSRLSKKTASRARFGAAQPSHGEAGLLFLSAHHDSSPSLKQNLLFPHGGAFSVSLFHLSLKFWQKLSPLRRSNCQKDSVPGPKTS
jgi:hypothetical protein